MMATGDDTSYYGTWKIVECVSLAGLVEPTGIEGTIFNLDANGDVSWKVPEDAESLPFFSCETYQVTSGTYGDPAVLKFFGTYGGHMIEFRVEVSDDLMLLTYERCCMLQCQKISSSEPRDETPFHLLSALDEGYFSDVTITSDSGKKFHVHSVILRLNSPRIDWTAYPTPLERLPSDVIEAMLHFLYAECLPESLTEQTAQACIKIAAKLSGFDKFCRICEAFVKSVVLKHQLMGLVGDVHACMDRVIELYSDRFGTTASDLMSNPAKLCCVLKHTMREIAIGCTHMLTFCDLFSSRKGELSHDEQHEIIKYTKTRLPVALKQLHLLLCLCKEHTSSLNPTQIRDMASYFLPESETILELVRRLFLDVRSALEQTITTSMNTVSKKHTEKFRKKGHLGDVLGHTLKHALHMRELKKLRRFHEKMTEEFCFLTVYEQKFKAQTYTEKIDLTMRNMEQLINELPFIIQRLEYVMAIKVSWKDWKYLFKLGTSKIAWALNKVQANEPSLRETIQEICDLVQRDVFTKSLESLHLFHVDPSATHPSSPTQSSEVRSLCCSPPASDSNSVQQILELLQSGKYTDMVFDVVEPKDVADETIELTNPSLRLDAGPEHCEIGAHRVIVAARCNWFKRALLSGMRESLDKKITIHDTNSDLFRLYLRYLYVGSIELPHLTTDQLADMMTLADKFESECLKRSCEQVLCKRLNDDTCLYLLTLADQLYAQCLRDEAVCYVAKHRGTIDRGQFNALPEHILLSVEDRIYWHRLSETENLPHTDTSSSSLSEVEDLLNNVNILQQNDASFPSNSSDDLDIAAMSHDPQLNECVRSLRDIVASTVTDDTLHEVAIAANYDVNRALNYLFSSYN